MTASTPVNRDSTIFAMFLALHETAKMTLCGTTERTYCRARYRFPETNSWQPLALDSAWEGGAQETSRCGDDKGLREHTLVAPCTLPRTCNVRGFTRSTPADGKIRGKP
jgi:hypothetical protein